MAVALCARVADSLAKRFTALLSASTSCICMRSEDMSTAIPVGEDHGSANEPPDPSCLPLVPLMGSPSKAEHEPEASHPGPTPASAAFCRMLLGSFPRVARRAREISYCIVGWPLRRSCLSFQTSRSLLLRRGQESFRHTKPPTLHCPSQTI